MFHALVDDLEAWRRGASVFECREQACAAAAVVRGAGARRRAVYRYLGLRPQFVQLLPCNIRREGGYSLVMLEGKEGIPL